MLDINVDLSGLTNLSGPVLQEALDAGLDRGAEVVMQSKQQQMQRTYSRVIPTSRTGRAKWKRSGDWMQGQQTERGHNTRTIKTVGEATKYEERLANLPTGPDGVNRTNAAAEDAKRITEPQVVVVVEQEIVNRLGV